METSGMFVSRGYQMGGQKSEGLSVRRALGSEESADAEKCAWPRTAYLLRSVLGVPTPVQAS